MLTISDSSIDRALTGAYGLLNQILIV